MPRLARKKEDNLAKYERGKRIEKKLMLGSQKLHVPHTFSHAVSFALSIHSTGFLHVFPRTSQVHCLIQLLWGEQIFNEQAGFCTLFNHLPLQFSNLFCQVPHSIFINLFLREGLFHFKTQAIHLCPQSLVFFPGGKVSIFKLVGLLISQA